MGQHDLIIDNASGAVVRADLNNALQGLGTLSSGASEPSTKYAYMFWADTTSGLLKIRNAANTAWIIVGTLADVNFGLAPLASPVFTGVVGAPTINLTGGQIAFPATQAPGSDPNTLDDYEEGTWTITLTGSGGSAGAIAYSYQSGVYTKIGNIVTIIGRVILTNNGDWTGNVKIAGFPFAPAVDAVGAAALTNITYDGQPVAWQQAGGAFYIGIQKTGTALTQLPWSGVPDNGEIKVTITYKV